MKKFSKDEINSFIEMLDFSKIEGNLVPIITQDYNTNEVLMLAFANEEALRQTLETGIACYYSRSRKKLWKKGCSFRIFGGVLNLFNAGISMTVVSLVILAYPIFGWLEHIVSSSGILMWLVDKFGFVAAMLPEVFRQIAAFV